MQTDKAASHKFRQILECHITCNMGTRDLPNMYAYSQLWAYISGKSVTPVLQLLHVTNLVVIITFYWMFEYIVAQIIALLH